MLLDSPSQLTGGCYSTVLVGMLVAVALFWHYLCTCIWWWGTGAIYSGNTPVLASVLASILVSANHRPAPSLPPVVSCRFNLPSDAPIIQQHKIRTSLEVQFSMFSKLDNTLESIRVRMPQVQPSFWRPIIQHKIRPSQKFWKLDNTPENIGNRMLQFQTDWPNHTIQN